MTAVGKQEFDLPEDANWASVILTTNGLPDEVMAVAASYDSTLRYGAQTPFSDQLAFHWEGSLWEFDAQHNSIITAGNGGTKPIQALFTIYYNQGTQKYQLEQSLQPDEQMWIDLGKLIREKTPDKNGNILPADLSSGSYELRDLTNKGVGTLFEGKVVYDRTYGHVTYGCGGCCGYITVSLWYNPLLIPLSVLTGTGVNAYNACDSNLEDVSDAFYGAWTTANHAIATVDYYGNHTGFAVGTTSSATSGQLQSDHQKLCPILSYKPGGNDDIGAIPTKFTLESALDAGGGDLHMVWIWQSSSGKLSDLATCSVSENVKYPGTGGTYSWPTPFPAIGVQNPTTGSVPGTDGTVIDDHDLEGKLDTDFRKPYSANSFVAQQTISYSCTYGGKTLTGTLFGAAPITRAVAQNGSWYFKVDELVAPGEDYSATINPLP